MLDPSVSVILLDPASGYSADEAVGIGAHHCFEDDKYEPETTFLFLVTIRSADDLRRAVGEDLGPATVAFSRPDEDLRDLGWWGRWLRRRRRRRRQGVDRAVRQGLISTPGKAISASPFHSRNPTPSFASVTSFGVASKSPRNSVGSLPPSRSREPRARAEPW